MKESFANAILAWFIVQKEGIPWLISKSHEKYPRLKIGTLRSTYKQPFEKKLFELSFKFSGAKGEWICLILPRNLTSVALDFRLFPLC